MVSGLYAYNIEKLQQRDEIHTEIVECGRARGWRGGRLTVYAGVGGGGRE